MLSDQRRGAASSWFITRKLSILLVVVTTLSLCLSCASTPQPTRVVAQEPVAKDVRKACDRITEIKMLPFKDEPVNDPVYNELTATGEKAIPCLIEKVTDTTPMADPRMSPMRYSDLRVGDVALFVLGDVAGLDFYKFLPAQVQEKVPVDGVYAYFEYVEKPEHREEIQNALKKWYRQKYGESANP
ncbi:MAG: hypothetical protein LC803_09060 [Acidobacteria bacterium]|nr:hypothetical protein [Acidobacteriota bacterium]